MILTICTYIILSFFYGALFTFAYMCHQGDEKKVKEGILIASFAYAWNVIYTGILGWHFVAGSPLEWSLDISDGIILYYGTYLILKETKAEWAFKKVIADDGSAIMRGITIWDKNDKRHTIGYGWAHGKRNWWYRDGDPSTMKFIWWRKRPVDRINAMQYGLYIGRLGLAYLKER